MNPRHKSKKNKGKKSKSIASAVAPVTKKQASLGRTLLQTGGAALGNIFGLGKLGRSAGDFVADITGMGTYKVNSNSIMKGSDSIPSFTHGDDYVIMSHREYVQDVYASQNFSTRDYEINPANAELFPTLSNIAVNFEQSEFLGLVFAFNPTAGDAIASTNNALGSVVMATQYDVTREPFQLKFEMENHEYSSSGKPSEALLHPIECNPKQDIVNSRYNHNVLKVEASNSYGENLVDLGRFQIATVGQQSTNINIGELWCTYKVKLLKPRIPGTSQYLGTFHAGSSGTSTLLTGGGAAMQPFGLNGTSTFVNTTQTMSRVFIDGNRLYLAGLRPGTKLLITYSCLFYDRSAGLTPAYIELGSPLQYNECEPFAYIFPNSTVPSSGPGSYGLSIQSNVSTGAHIWGQMTFGVKTNFTIGNTYSPVYVDFPLMFLSGPSGVTFNFRYDLNVSVVPELKYGTPAVLQGSSIARLDEEMSRLRLQLSELTKSRLPTIVEELDEKKSSPPPPPSPSIPSSETDKNTVVGPSSLRVRDPIREYELVSHSSR